MSERTVTMKGNTMHLEGQAPTIGKPAPAFTLTAVDLSTKTLSDYSGKVIILSTIPSIDTGICDLQSKRFSKELAELGSDFVVLTVSVDLPFAAKRWCGANGVTNVAFLSDYKDHSFSKAYGLRIKELGLIARSVSVIDKTGKITYHQIVPEIAQEPDYAPVLAAAKAAR